MALEEDLNTRLKECMKARDTQAVNVLRMVKSRILEKKKASGFEGEVSDALVLQVIGTYVKQMRKAQAEYGRMGEAGQAQAEALGFEITFLEPYLPTKLDRAATHGLVSAVIESQGIADPRQVGRVIGAVMKTHRDQVDPAVVREIAQELLAD